MPSAYYVDTPAKALEQAKYRRGLGYKDVVIQFCYPVGKTSDGKWVVGVKQGWERSDEALALQQVILEDPAASFWLQDALRSALERDPVDAANDSEVLADVLRAICDEKLRAGLAS